MLPYQTLKPVETVVVAGFPLPKRGCLTVAEMHATAELDAKSKAIEGLTPIQKDLLLKQEVATILLKSRLDPNWTLENTQRNYWDVIVDGEKSMIEPDMQMLDELFEFFMGEQRRWAEPEPVTEKKEPTGRKSTGS